MTIRSTAKAIIIDKGRVLLNKCFDEYNGEYYSLPGGGQNQYETLHEAVIRECLEETGYHVIPKKFVALYEEICENPETRRLYPDYAHKMYHIFLCELADGIRREPVETDLMQVSIDWIKIEDLHKVRLLPKVLNENLKELIEKQNAMFLGSDYTQHGHA